MSKNDDLKDYETIEREMLENIAEKTRNFSLLDFFNKQGKEKSVIAITDTQVICAITPVYYKNKSGKKVEWRHVDSIKALKKHYNIDHYPLILFQLCLEEGWSYAYEFVYESAKEKITPRMKEIRDEMREQINRMSNRLGIESYLSNEYEAILIDNPDNEDAVQCGITLTDFLRHLVEDGLRIGKTNNDKATRDYLDDRYWANDYGETDAYFDDWGDYE